MQVDRKPKRAERLIESLKARIESGALQPGDKLPTEVELVRDFAVSRTVVREALAVLAGDGLVQARQGAGVFVLDRPKSPIGGLAMDLKGSLSAVLNVLEVRMAVEIEAAALAAQRRSAAQEGEIREAYERFTRELHADRPTGEADFQFHRSIAIATNNPFYVEILDVLGRRTIPRDLFPMVAPEVVQSREYLESLQAEHGRILDAITLSDPHAAREAMRSHLAVSQRRYQVLLQKSAAIRTAVAAEAPVLAERTV